MKLQVQRDVPYPQKPNKDLIAELLALKDGDYVFVPYKGLTKSIVSNCVTSARLRIAKEGLTIKTIGQPDGLRIWVVKKQ